MACRCLPSNSLSSEDSCVWGCWLDGALVVVCVDEIVLVDD